MADFRKLSEDDAARLKNWWYWLDDNRGDRAQLRRAGKVDDVLLTSAFSHFLQKMPGYWGVAEGQKGIALSDAAMVAAALAKVKSLEENNSFSRTLALPKERGGKAVMSELRFQQLQKSHTPDEFFIRICRAVDLLGGKVNIISLADDILLWLSEYRFGSALRPQYRLAVRWATDYYEVCKK